MTNKYFDKNHPQHPKQNEGTAKAPKGSVAHGKGAFKAKKKGKAGGDVAGGKKKLK